MPTPLLHGQQLEVLEMNEIFEESDGLYQFAGTFIVYRAESNLYHAVLKARYSSPANINPEDLSNIVQIPVSAYNPRYSSELSRAPDPLPEDCFVKKPRLTSYDRVYKGPQPNAIAESVLAEARICELLMRHPHPNIATYLGCHVSSGRITGLCFVQYSHTLMEEVNPGALMKRRLRSTRQPTKDYSGFLTGIESGIRHLHSLGLAHNDINPSNIMVDGDNPIIIDFGSCRPLGECLEGVGRTYEWYDEKVQQSVPDNDLHALKEIRIWLGEDPQDFQFDE